MSFIGNVNQCFYYGGKRGGGGEVTVRRIFPSRLGNQIAPYSWIYTHLFISWLFSSGCELIWKSTQHQIRSETLFFYSLIWCQLPTATWSIVPKNKERRSLIQQTTQHFLASIVNPESYNLPRVIHYLPVNNDWRSHFLGESKFTVTSGWLYQCAETIDLLNIIRYSMDTPIWMAENPV